MILSELFVDEDVGDVVSVNCEKPEGNNWITLSSAASNAGFTVDMAPPTNEGLADGD